MPMASTAESVSSLTFCSSLPVLLMPEGQQVLCWTCLPLLPYKADLLKYFPHISSSSQKHLRFFFFPPYSICRCTSFRRTTKSLHNSAARESLKDFNTKGAQMDYSKDDCYACSKMNSLQSL